MIFFHDFPHNYVSGEPRLPVYRINNNYIIPLFILLAINLSAGFLTFKNYGMSWDEPLFYDYADSIRIAYSPQAFAPGFNFYEVFGKSPEDHKIYGPAYLLLARPFQQLATNVFSTDNASAWHLVNFITFQIGLITFYILALRWLDLWPAIAATAFFAWQPVFWGHAFINPKDIPFMVFFLLAITLGLEFTDQLKKTSNLINWLLLLLAALILGLTSATRVIGPLAGAVVLIYFLMQKNWRAIPLIGSYVLVSIVVMVFFWPYLWSNPVDNFIAVLKHMSNNPTELAVLFNGQIFRANAMPLSYIPKMLALTLTEPTWLLFFSGCLVTARNLFNNKLNWQALSVVFGLFVFMLTYLLVNRPAVYDGFRHFFFITPPIFIMVGFSFQWIWEKLKPQFWIAIISVILASGIFNIISLHPYEYTYYNILVSGVRGAYRTYETDYWLTCYKEAVEWTRANYPGSVLHIQREYPLAKYYASDQILKDLTRETEQDIKYGDLILFHTRGDLDIRSIYRKLPVIHEFGRDAAQYCIIKQKK